MAETGKNRPRNDRAEALTAEELCRRLEASRAGISSGAGSLGEAINPAGRMERSFSAHPARWLAAAALGGIIGARLLFGGRRRSGRGDDDGTGKDRRGAFSLAAIFGFLTRSLFFFAKPAVSRILQERFEEFVD